MIITTPWVCRLINSLYSKYWIWRFPASLLKQYGSWRRVEEDGRRQCKSMQKYYRNAIGIPLAEMRLLGKVSTMLLSYSNPFLRQRSFREYFKSFCLLRFRYVDFHVNYDIRFPAVPSYQLSGRDHVENVTWSIHASVACSVAEQ